MSVNRFTCTGNLTKDPELRKLPSGDTVCELRLAVDGMAGVEEPGFITVSVFGKGGEAAAEYLGKGWLVAVDGRLAFSEWEGEGGVRRHEYSVIGQVDFLAAPRHSQEPSGEHSREREAASA